MKSVVRHLACWAIFVACVLSCRGVYAQGGTCTDEQARRADADVDRLHTWDQLYRSFQRYRQCDGGAIAEGYSKSVARILAHHWKTLPRLAYLAKRSDGFWHFVLDHINATADEDDLRRIKRRAATQCPTGLRRMCRDIRKAAEAAIEDLAPEENHALLR